MGNTLEFILQLKDRFSSGLYRISGNSSRLFSSMNRQAKQVPRSIDQINAALDKLKHTRKLSIDVSQIQQANREIKKLEAELHNLKGGGPASTGTGGGGLLSMATRYAIPAAIASGTYRLGRFSVAAGTEQENAKIGLRTFLGDGTDQAYSNIQKDAASTPFDLQTLISVNRALISAGANSKEARSDTLALANAVSAVGGGNDVLHRMAANMQQIRTVGKATAMDIRQFGMAGINIYSLLAKATGKTVDEIKKMEIGYDTLSYALRQASMEGGEYFGAMEAQSQTLQGRWNTMWDEFKANAGESVITLKPVISTILDMGNKFMGVVGRMMQRWSFGVRFYIADIKMGLFKVSERVAMMAITWKTAMLRVQEFGDIALQKLNNLYNAADRFLRLDFKGAKQFWNKEEKSEYTTKRQDYAKSSVDLLYKLQVKRGELQMKKFNLQREAREMEEGFKSPRTKYTMQLGALGNSTFKGKQLKRGAKSTVDRITGGGVRNVTINLGKFFDTLNINTTNLKSGSDEIEAKLTDMLLRVVNSGGAITQ